MRKRKLQVSTILKRLGACERWQKWGQQFGDDAGAAVRAVFEGRGLPTSDNPRYWLCWLQEGSCVCTEIDVRMTMELLAKKGLL